MSSTMSTTVVDIPEELFDPNTKTHYRRNRYFGKGGFAKCYELINAANQKAFAGKIIAKNQMTKQDQKDKMTQEITIHKSLRHKNIVQFYSFFDDPQNVYIILELCKKRSMMELHKRRKVITDFECRYYINQILDGLKYLHDRKIIHRDLKLGNLFLNDELNVKIGDFGLATTIAYDGERKKTICGTPNYIAPEILNKKGHSYEVDIWSVGCVMYTLLAGKPPFETKTLKETYGRIRKCEYKLPSAVRASAADMIVAMLQPYPEKRPSVDKLFTFEFMAKATIPLSLPISCLTMAPRADQLEYCDRYGGRKPLTSINTEAMANRNEIGDGMVLNRNEEAYRQDIDILKKELATILQKLYMNKNNMDPDFEMSDDLTDPASQPLFWISKWVDYSDKYGFGYQLCDEGVGVLFNDGTKLIVLGNGLNVHFIDKNSHEQYMTTNDYPTDMEKKIKLLSYFKRYMTEHLVKTGASNVSEFDSVSRVPHLHAWFRTSCAVVMYLTNGTVQMNFSDHVKIILCPLMLAVTVVLTDKNFRTYKFSTLRDQGCSSTLLNKLHYAYEKLGTLFSK